VVVMVTKKEFNNSIKKAKDWDGKSRPSNDTYRDSWDRIFGQKEEEELKESFEQSKRNKIERQDLIDSIMNVEKKSGKDLVSLIIERKRKEMNDKKK